MSWHKAGDGRYYNLANFDRLYVEKNGKTHWIIAQKIINNENLNDREFVIACDFDTKEQAQEYLDMIFV